MLILQVISEIEKSSMKVLKFGGTSIGTHEGVDRVKEIVLTQQEDVIVVVSAVSVVTD